MEGVYVFRWKKLLLRDNEPKTTLGKNRLLARHYSEEMEPLARLTMHKTHSPRKKASSEAHG